MKPSRPSSGAYTRTASGNLKVIRWSVSDDGETVTKEFEADAGVVQDLAMVGTFDQSVVTAVVTQEDNYKNILWTPNKEENPDAFVRWGESSAGFTDRLDVEETDTGLLISGVRTAEGNLKIITWWIGHGGGNSLVILHGNCRVLYAHFQENSVNPAVASAGSLVAAGQQLGRMGNSGSSSGPHLHIHASRISSFLSPEQAIELEAEGELETIAYRPIPFHGARAMRLSAIQPGGESNPDNAFDTIAGHGVYFERFHSV